MVTKRGSFVRSGLNGMAKSLHRLLLMALIVSSLIVIGCVQTSKGPSPENQPPASFTDLKPITPQPPESSIRPGVNVWYFPDFKFQHIGEMPKGEPPFSWGFAGKPILIIDRKFAPQENVFDSGFHKEVALQMDGMIKLPKAGEYWIEAYANDGIRVYIDNQRVVNDPYWHSDEFSPKTKMEISAPGWYLFKLQYFQRLGTATLRLLWKKPGDADFSAIPADSYGHLSGSK
jgi:hypothetical protein